MTDVGICLTYASSWYQSAPAHCRLQCVSYIGAGAPLGRPWTLRLLSGQTQNSRPEWSQGLQPGPWQEPLCYIRQESVTPNEKVNTGKPLPMRDFIYFLFNKLTGNTHLHSVPNTYYLKGIKLNIKHHLNNRVQSTKLFYNSTLGRQKNPLRPGINPETYGFSLPLGQRAWLDFIFTRDFVVYLHSNRHGVREYLPHFTANPSHHCRDFRPWVQFLYVGNIMHVFH